MARKPASGAKPKSSRPEQSPAKGKTSSSAKGAKAPEPKGAQPKAGSRALNAGLAFFGLRDVAAAGQNADPWEVVGARARWRARRYTALCLLLLASIIGLLIYGGIFFHNAQAVALQQQGQELAATARKVFVLTAREKREAQRHQQLLESLTGQQERRQRLEQALRALGRKLIATELKISPTWVTDSFYGLDPRFWKDKVDRLDSRHPDVYVEEVIQAAQRRPLVFYGGKDDPGEFYGAKDWTPGGIWESSGEWTPGGIWSESGSSSSKGQAASKMEVPKKPRDENSGGTGQGYGKKKTDEKTSVPPGSGTSGSSSTASQEKTSGNTGSGKNALTDEQNLLLQSKVESQSGELQEAETKLLYLASGRLFVAVQDIRALNIQVLESESRLTTLQGSLEAVKATRDFRDPKGDRTQLFLTTQLNRFGGLAVIIAIVVVLAGLFRYCLRLKAHYDGLSDVLRLLGTNQNPDDLVAFSSAVSASSILPGSGSKMSLKEAVDVLAPLLKK